MSADGCGMDSYGCGGVRGTGGDRKTRQRETQTVSQCMFDTLWPGKFPPKICADRHRGVRMGAAVAAAAEKIAAAAEISSNSRN